jgi:ABC-type multidrug transport system fused ATPase/permease subunit
MFSKLAKLFRLLELRDQIKVFILFFMTIIAMLIEVSSVFLVLPLIREFLSPTEKLSFINNFPLIINLVDPVYILLLLFLLIHLIKFLYLTYFNYQQNKFINNLSAKLTVKLFSNYIFKDYESQTKKKTSVILRKLITDTKLLCSSFINPLFVLIIEFLVIFGIVVFLFIFQRDISIATSIIFFLLILIYSLTFKKKFLKWGNSRQYLDNISLKLILDSFNGIKDIIIYSKESYFREKFIKNEFSHAAVAEKYQTFQQLPRLVFEFVIILLLILLILYLKIKGLSNNSIIEIISVFGVACLRFIPSASRVIGSFQLMRFATSSLDSILSENIYHSQYYDNLAIKKNKILKRKFNQSIIFKNISFYYQGKKDEIIFKNLNLEINKNEIIGLYGPSGSGKSTFADLLTGLLKPTSGSIFLDRMEIHDNNNDNFLKLLFAYVPQQVYLLDDTIKNNITLGEEENFINYQKLNESINLSQLSQFVDHSAKGINTIIGERGSMLSGGQVQRLGIARALYHHSEILIFDESTNSLDTEVEKKIMNEIKELKKIKTIIIISHKLELLKICDKIYELKNKTLNLKT